MLVQLRRCRPSEPKALSLYSMLVGSICQHAICVTPENEALESYREHLLTALSESRRRSSSRHLDCFEAARLVNAGRCLPIENVNQVPTVRWNTAMSATRFRVSSRSSASGIQLGEERSTHEVNLSVCVGFWWGGDEFGGSSTARGRVVGECPSSLQAQGAAGRHYQGGQASLLLPEAGREEARQGSFSAKACSKKES